MISNKDLELGSRAVLNLHGFFIITDKDEIIDNPQVIIQTLKPDELYLMDYFDELDANERADLEDILVRENVMGIYGYPDSKISCTYTPAGIVASVAKAVLELSFKYLENKDGRAYKEKLETVTYLESMQAIVSYYLQIPYSDVTKMTLSELYKKHAICAATFPSQVNPLCSIEENGL